MGVVYRVKQFWRAWQEVPDTRELEIARLHLPAPLYDLFRRMQPGEQAHSLDVLQKLQAAGQNHPALMVAALLHDVGKSRHPLSIWERVWIVLARIICPNCVQRWGRGSIHSWLRPFVVAEQHPEWGAEMAAEAGAPALAVGLIRRHQEPRLQQPEGLEDHLLDQLQRFDNQS